LFFQPFIYNEFAFYMMVSNKLTEQDVKEIKKLLKEGHTAKELAKRFGVHRSTIYDRAKYGLKAARIPVETKNKVIKVIKQGYTKAEAAQMYNLNIGTVNNFTRGIVKGHGRQGNHIIRKNGIKLLNRLMADGYLVSDFLVPNARLLQKHFPMIRNARFKDKTFFYLAGREEEAIEGYFKEKPDRIISYVAVQELSKLLGVEFHKSHALRLTRKYKGQHDQYWKSRKLIQKPLDEWM